MIRKFFYILLGLYFILSPFVFKIIIIKLPKNISEVSLIFIIISILLYFYLIFKILQNFTIKKENILSNFIKNNITIPIQQMYINSMSYIDNYIKDDLLGPKYLGTNMLKITKKLNKFLTDFNSIIIFILIDLLPRILLIIIILTDINNKSFNYVYIFGGIALIPLVFRYLIYTFKGFAITNIKGLTQECVTLVGEDQQEIIIEHILENYQTVYFNSNLNIKRCISFITLRIDADILDFDASVDFYLNQLHVFSTLYTSMDFFEQIKKQNYYQIFLLTIYIIYFVIWLYIFIYVYSLS